MKGSTPNTWIFVLLLGVLYFDSNVNETQSEKVSEETITVE